MKQYLIALDLDGTLLNTKKHISSGNQTAVHRALQEGHRVILASGRMHEATARYANILGLSPDNMIVSYNGALIRTLRNEIIFEQPLPVDAAAFIVDFAAEHNYHLNYYLDDQLYVREIDQWAVLYQNRTGSIPNAVGDLNRFHGRLPTKLIIVGSKAVTDDLLIIMRGYFDDRLYITKTDDEYLEFMHRDVSKGNALAIVAEKLGIPQERCYAFGDNHNDIPMLQWAGCGIAMGNSKPEVKAVADEVVLSADEDGVAVRISQLLN